MKKYNFVIKGESDLLLHHDNLTWNSKLKTWLKDPENKKMSEAGDDRTPGFLWIGYCYLDADKGLVMPSDNLMTVLREGGAKCPTGKRQETFKKYTQSGIILDSMDFPLLDPRSSKQYKLDGYDKYVNETEYDEHVEWAKSLGFELFAKRAKVGQNKHVRVRPRFIHWEVRGQLTVIDAVLTKGVMEQIMKFAGHYSGLGDWRPSSPKSPGPFGRFSTEIYE